jgi:hypothetical protein
VTVLLFRGTDNIAFNSGAPSTGEVIVNSPVWLKGFMSSDMFILLKFVVFVSRVAEVRQRATNRPEISQTKAGNEIPDGLFVPDR